MFYVSPQAVTRANARLIIAANADALIEQLEREAKGWDRGAYRDDDTVRGCTIKRWRKLVAEQVAALAPVAV